MNTTLPEPVVAWITRNKTGLWDALSGWWQVNRRSFPWRKDGVTAYEVMVAEVALKRTTATAATRAFNRLISKYPDVKTLANADVSVLCMDLADIGLHNQRARGLKDAAVFVCEKYDCTIPARLGELLAIPHIGEYAARAILAFAFGQPVGIVDSNVIRVIGRLLYGVLPVPTRNKDIQEIIDKSLPADCPREFNWALLDFSALVCRYGKPRCADCNLRYLCSFYQQCTLSII